MFGIKKTSFSQEIELDKIEKHPGIECAEGILQIRLSSLSSSLQAKYFSRIKFLVDRLDLNQSAFPW